MTVSTEIFDKMLQIGKRGFSEKNCNLPKCVLTVNHEMQLKEKRN